MTIHIFEIQRQEGTGYQWEAVKSETTLEKAREAMRTLNSEYPMYSYTVKEVEYTNTTLQYYKKNVYGNECLYLKDCNEARVVLELIGQRTISRGQIARFEALGLKFVEVLA